MTKLKKAKNFELQNQKGEWVKLSDFAGQVCVIYFYPKAMTPGCTKQACGIRDAKDVFKKKKITVLGVSADSVERLEKFTIKEKLNFDLLSDPDHKVAKAYDAFGPKSFMGKSYEGILRKTFVINNKGEIAYEFQKVITGTHSDDVLNWIETNLLE